MSFLPGMGAFLPESVAPLPPEMVASAIGFDATVTVPATVIAGDLLVLVDCARSNSGDPTNVVPSGFTQLVTNLGSNNRITVSYKIADADDESDVLTGMAEAVNSERKMLAVFRASSPIVSVTPSTWLAEAASGTPGAQDILASGVATPVIVIAGMGASSAISAYTFSPAADGEIDGSFSAGKLAWKSYAADPQDHTVSMSDFGAMNCIASGYLRLHL